MGEEVRLRLAHGGVDGSVGGGASGGSLPILYFDTAARPIVSTISPIFGPVHAPTRVTVHGWNLAPTRKDLRCRFGDAPFTGACFFCLDLWVVSCLEFAPLCR